MVKARSVSPEERNIMSECKHERPILVHLRPSRIVPAEQPYDDDSDKYVSLDIIWNYEIALTGHYCTECDTLLDVDCDGE